MLKITALTKFCLCLLTLTISLARLLSYVLVKTGKPSYLRFYFQCTIYFPQFGCIN